MSQQTRVHIVTYDPEGNRWLNHQGRMLIELYHLSDKTHLLVDEPAEADIILLVDVWENVWEHGRIAWVENVSRHPVIERYPGQSFSLSDIDAPVILHHGIYANGEKGLLSIGRVCTGSYALYFDNARNPFVEQFEFDASAQVEKRYLFTFMGRRSHPVRIALFALAFDRQDILIEDSSAFDFFGNANAEKLARQEHYFETLLHSKFALCPRGSGASSLRLFESMRLGVAPVIISDRWILPRCVRWPEFSIIIKEKNIREIEKIVASHESSYEEMGLLAREAYEENFGPDVYFNTIVDSCLYIRDKQWVPEALYQRLNPLYIRLYRVRSRLRLRSRVKALLGSLKVADR